MDAIQAVRTRRSVRRFRPDPVGRDTLEALVEEACCAPSPHGTRPWRFAVLTAAEAKRRLAERMGRRWESDLRGDNLPDEVISRRVERSHRRITGSPAVIVACLVKGVLDTYPDERRQNAEYTMGAHSLGAALQNILLGAHTRGLAGFWMCAPIFCPDEARLALDLDPSWEPQAMVLLGYPAEPPPAREPRGVQSMAVFR
jgi:coenzyme F420-0:L-glutamate ligase/coenzyme F420-1:gamma-L-glutamate ligase